MNISTIKPKKSLISLTPLIDVVFILLIFFMLASSFIEWRSIQLNVANAGATTITDKQHSIIHIEENQRYTLNETTLSLEEIKIHLQEKAAQNQPHTVLVQPSHNLPLQQLVSVLEVLETIQTLHVSLLSSSQSDGD